MCTNFAKETVKHENLKNMLPMNENSSNVNIRNHEVFKVNMALTERYKTSAIPQMQRLLNKSFFEDKDIET